MKILWSIAGFVGMTGGLLAWVVGFRVPQQESLITSTLALMIGMGGFWMLDRRGRRWSWILELIGLVLGFYFNFSSPYFPTPSIFIALSLLLAAMAGLLGMMQRSRRHPADETQDMERVKGG